VETRGDSPEEHIEAEHGAHDGEVAQHAHGIAQLVDQQEPPVYQPARRGGGRHAGQRTQEAGQRTQDKYFDFLSLF